MTCEKCGGTGIAIGERVDKISVYRLNGRTITRWEYERLSQALKDQVTVEEREVWTPAGYLDQVCTCETGKRRSERMLGRVVDKPGDEWRGKDRGRRRP